MGVLAVSWLEADLRCCRRHYGPNKALSALGYAPRPFSVGFDLVALDFTHSERLNLPDLVHLVG
ncbi:hypothetical protein NBRC3299_2758 [Acetobacter pasteurianus NBRC 3299]|nr:hypothetical protein NBRC3299_2758 [Acetobacter pasteurianus NBRC 3299]